MPKVVADTVLDQVRTDRQEIDQIRAQLAAKIRERNRRIVAAVDEGWPQDRVADAAGVGPTAVTKILATTAPEPPAPIEP